MEKITDQVTVGSTAQVDASVGRHIVYTYTDYHKYLENVASFIAEGIQKDQIVICVDYPERFDPIMERLKHAGFSDSQLNDVFFVDSVWFYEAHGAFNIDAINGNFVQLINSYFKEDRSIRIWGSVTWKEQKQEMLKSQMSLHEHNYDCFISSNPNVLAVCAYNASELPASFMNAILQTHEFHMTDTDLSSSHFYNKKPVLLPEIQEQIKLTETAEKEMARSEKLHIATDLAGNVAHELGNPLAVIKGFIQLIQKNGDLSVTNQGYLGTISGQVEKIEQLASEFLALANPYLGNTKEVDIPQLVADVQEQMDSQAAAKAIEIWTEFDYEAMTVIGDDAKIKQILINVVKNSIEAMDQGIITMQVKNMAEYIHIYVIDNGPGIPNDIIDQIGKPFLTTKESGTGLGLLISEKIAAGHQGTLHVESADGQGTTVTVSLPKSAGSQFATEEGWQYRDTITE